MTVPRTHITKGMLMHGADPAPRGWTIKDRNAALCREFPELTGHLKDASGAEQRLAELADEREALKARLQSVRDQVEAIKNRALR